MKNIGKLSIFFVLMIFQISSTTFAQQLDRFGNPIELMARNWVEQTALFPGDVVTYHIEIQCFNDLDILLDDLAEDELILTGLEIISSEIEQKTEGSITRYHVSYKLVSFETNITDLEIHELSLRFYQKRLGQLTEDIATVGEIVVPSISLVMRSTLPSESSSYALRDVVPAQTISSLLETTRGVGLFLIIVMGVPMVLVISSYFKKDLSKTRPQTEEITRAISSELRQIKQHNLQDNQQRQECFDQLEKLLKEYIEETTDVPATALTANELLRDLVKKNTKVPLEELSAVLKDCEQARYDRKSNLPDAHRAEHAISLAESLLTH